VEDNGAVAWRLEGEAMEGQGDKESLESGDSARWTHPHAHASPRSWFNPGGFELATVDVTAWESSEFIKRINIVETLRIPPAVSNSSGDHARDE
jgi:hypothetical protein